MGTAARDARVLNLSGPEAAAFIGVSYRQLQNLLTSPYPPPRQHDKTYRSDDLGQWLREKVERDMRVEIKKDPTKLDANQELARKNKELADKTALENEVRRGKLIEADVVKMAWSMILMRVKTRLLSLPTSMAAMVAHEDDQAVVQEMLREGVADALGELSSDWTDADDDEDQ